MVQDYRIRQEVDLQSRLDSSVKRLLKVIFIGPFALGLTAFIILGFCIQDGIIWFGDSVLKMSEDIRDWIGDRL